jgi:hypothetical protein
MKEGAVYRVFDARTLDLRMDEVEVIDCDRCRFRYGRYVIAKDEEEACAKARSGEWLCGTCLIEEIIERYALIPLG